MASLPQHRATHGSGQSSHDHSAEQDPQSECGQESPTTQDTASDTVLISPAPRPLSRSDQPAHTPPAADTSPPSFSSSARAQNSNQQTANISPTSYSSPTWQPPSQDPKPSLTRQSTSNEPKKCWICFGDSTEDGPDTSSWRTPCPCALTAHETCLLDWIADLEAPSASTTQSARRRKNKIQCPQCKTEIRVARPWSPVVASIRAVERITGTLVLPGVAGAVLGGLYSACFVHGALSAILVFGQDDWAKLMDASPDGRPIQAGFRVMLGLPMVPVVLVLSRTKLGDSFLPIIPLIFLAPEVTAFQQLRHLVISDGAGSRMINGANHLWPPNAATAFATLPYLRTFYNAAFGKLFAAKQREWMRAVQREPRPGEEEAQFGVNGGDAPGAADDLEIELNAQIQVLEEDDEDDELHDPEAVQQAINEAVEAAEARHEAEGNEGGDDADRNGGERQEPAPNRRANRQQPAQQNNGLILSASRVADAVLGALCFPAIAAMMGEALKLGLPAKWTNSPLTRRTGLLQSKWGRSIVGGCLFVVMKDALLLYSQYRLAQDHSKRRVLDYKGPPQRSRGTAR